MPGQHLASICPVECHCCRTHLELYSRYDSHHPEKWPPGLGQASTRRRCVMGGVRQAGVSARTSEDRTLDQARNPTAAGLLEARQLLLAIAGNLQGDSPLIGWA